MRMKQIFEGENGKTRLIEELQTLPLLAGCADLIAEVAEILELREVGQGDELLVQGEPGNGLTFVLTGAGAEVLIDNSPVAAREPGQVLGEMSAIEPSKPCSATVVAAGETLIGRLTLNQFDGLAKKYPETIYRGIAKIVSSRLRERSRFIRVRSSKPQVFIGSSVEGLKVAEAIRDEFDHFDADVCIWSDPGSVFKPSSTAIEDLTSSLNRFDFGIFVLTPDDQLILRRTGGNSEPMDAVRDNVLFEMGLFIGHLGRGRVFGVAPRGNTMRRPTDLSGVTLLEYDTSENNAPKIQTSVNQMKSVIRAKKAR